MKIRIARDGGFERIIIDIFDQNHRSKAFHDNIGFKPIYTIYCRDI